MNWTKVAKEFLEESGLPDSAVGRYAPLLAKRLREQAEDMVTCDFPDMEREREEAAYDAYINRQLDEMRGK